MVMRTRRPFEDFALTAANQQFNQPYSGEFLDAIAVQVDATLTATSGAAVEDQAARVLEDFELVHGTRSLIRVRGLELMMLSHLMTRGSRLTRSGSGGGAMAGNFSIPFGEMIPGGGIDASQVRLNAKGRTAAALSSFHSTATAIDGKLAIAGEGPGYVAPEGFYQPNWKPAVVTTESAKSDEQVRFDFETDVELLGFLVIAEDASGKARSDGIVRKIRVDHLGVPMQEWTWGQLKEATARYFKLGSGSGLDASNGVDLVPTGCVFIPTRDHGRKTKTKPLFVAAGTAIVLHLDTASTIENEFTALTLASGDKVTITPIAFERVGSTASRAQTEVGAKAARTATGRRISR